MPIDKLRSDTLIESSAASVRFARNLPNDLRNVYDENVGSHLAAAFNVARDTVATIDRLNDPDQPAVNHPKAVARDAIANGRIKYHTAIQAADEGIERLGRELEAGALPTEPDGTNAANARATILMAVGARSGAEAQTVVERLAGETDSHVAGTLVSSEWGRGFLDQIEVPRDVVASAAMRAAAAGRFGYARQLNAKALGAWGDLIEARSKAGAAEVVLSELERR